MEPFEPLEPTVADLARRYLEAHVAVNCRPATQETFQRLIDLYILPGLGDFAATAVERHHVCTLHEGLSGQAVPGEPGRACAIEDVLARNGMGG